MSYLSIMLRYFPISLHSSSLSCGKSMKPSRPWKNSTWLYFFLKKTNVIEGLRLIKMSRLLLNFATRLFTLNQSGLMSSTNTQRLLAH